MSEEVPDLMKALKASLDAVKAPDEVPIVRPQERVNVVKSASKHDDDCLRRRMDHPLLCSCGVSDEDYKKITDQIGRSEMTPGQALAHRYAAEAGRRSDALGAFRKCMRYAAVAEANGDRTCADLHRADARACLHLYPETLEAIDRAVGG